MHSQLSSLDQNFWNLETDSSRQTIALIGLLENPLAREDLSKLLRIASEYFPRMKQVVSNGSKLRWTDAKDFSLENHIVSRIGEIIPIVNEEFSAGIVKSLPLWKAVLIESPTQSAILFLCHHSFADGVGFMELFEGICSTTANGEIGLKELAIRKDRYTSRGSPSFQFRDAIKSFFGSLKKLISDARQESLDSPLNGANSQMRRVAYFDLDLATINKNRKVLSASLYEYMLSLTTSSVQSFYRSIDYPLEDARIIMPINLRTRNETMTLGNRISGASVLLPVQRESLEVQVKEIKRQILKLRENYAVGSYELLASFNARFPARIQRAISSYAAKKTSFICTSVPANTKDKYVAGSRITEIYGFPALMSHHGLAFAYIRGQAKMHVGLVYDPIIIEDPEALIQGFKEAHSSFK